MKSLSRFFLVIFVFLILAAGIGYFSVTRPAFQKKLIESKLPAGSSIKFVRITSNSIEPVSYTHLTLPTICSV